MDWARSRAYLTDADGASSESVQADLGRSGAVRAIPMSAPARREWCVGAPGVIWISGAADHSRSRNASRRSTAAGRFSRPKPIRKWFPGWPNCEPGRSSTPSASTSRAANASIGSSPSNRGNPIEPPRGRTHERRSARRCEEVVEDGEVVGDDPPRPGEDPVPRPKADQGQDLGRRRRADRRVVLHPRAAVEQLAVARREPADPEAGQRERLRHHARSRCRARRGRRPRSAARRRRARGSDRPRRRGGGSRDRRRRRRGGPTPRASGACPSGCAAR